MVTIYLKLQACGAMWEKCWFLREGKTGEPGEKPLGARKRTNKLNPHERLDQRIEPGPQWWEVSAPTTTIEIAQNLIKYKSVEFTFSFICCFQTQPTREVGSENWTRATVVRGECSHHYDRDSSKFNKIQVCGIYLLTHFLFSAQTIKKKHVDSSWFQLSRVESPESYLLSVRQTV